MVIPWLQEIYYGKRGRLYRSLLEVILSLFAGHIVLLVMQKVDQSNNCSTVL